MLPLSSGNYRVQNEPFSLPAQTGGLNAYSPIMRMPATDALVLDNLFPYPDRLQLRDGYVEHATGFTETPQRLVTYNTASGGEQLFACTNNGIFNVSSAGAISGAVAACSNGKVSSAMFSTGAGYFLFMVNGSDNLIRYNGASWTTVADFGTEPELVVNTSTLSSVEVYRQRVYFAGKNSLTLYYLPVNSISGQIVSYELGAICRRGGFIVALATWTIDGGFGPEDQLAVITSQGEVAIFAGSDPGNAASWSLRGVYYIGIPLGLDCVFKYGGDLLVLTENGLYPLSSATQSTSIDRRPAVSDKIRQLFNNAARDFASQDGWQVIVQPDIPCLIVNVPSLPTRTQFVMHTQTKSWCTYSGWEAQCLARFQKSLFFATTTKIMKVVGVNDNGAAITGRLITAYTRLNYSRTKQLVEIKPYFQTSAAHTYRLGVVPDFASVQETTEVIKGSGGPGSLWGTGIWGAALWGGSTGNFTSDWGTVGDDFSTHKALYMEVTTSTGAISYYGADGLFMKGGSF